MTDATFRIAFEGEPFRDGEIDVRDLAPSLLALGDVVKAANAAINGDRADARLMVRATKEGSFEALLTLDVNWITDMLDAISSHPDRVLAAEKLLDLLTRAGVVVGGAVGAATATTVGFFKAIKLLRGRRPDNIQGNDDGTTSITVGATTFSIESGTFVLLQDVETRAATERFGKKVLRVPGIDKLTIGGETPEREVSFAVSDLPAFDIQKSSNDEPETIFTKSELWLRIVTSQFREGYKWRFTDGGERTFTAEMEDANFLNKALSGSIALSANDALRCLVREEQVISGTDITKFVFIEKVLDHRPGAKQMKLL